MPKERNKPIGECECPQKGCDLTAQVFKYRAAGKNPNAWARRWAGKFYSCCGAGHKCTDSEYLAENAKIWGPNDKKHESAAMVECERAPVQQDQESKPPAPVTQPASPVPAPVQHQEKSRFWWWEWTT